MSVIIPAILPTSRKDLEEKLAQLEGLVDAVQVDVVDGRFVSPASWPYSNGTDIFAQSTAEGAMLPHVGQMEFEIDLMVSDPENVTGLWIAAGANRLTLHAESTTYLSRAIKDMGLKYGHSKDFAAGLLSMGLALNIESDLSLIEQYISSIDYVQFMGIATIGRQGEPFDTRVLRKISAFKRRHPKVQVQVDGGVSLVTAPALLSAGVDRLIVGSALWKAPHLADELKKFSELVEQYGIYT
jgi:ribulose-phosphate 3-epimerase